ncbi:helix-turn-helix domain-containing protein [Nonomuraea glycinis]|uniref:helix-turn-helix domain-containing protein n=1 Tax=Nonomuraea glycinis TaxID=2047744 RepID=UPI0033AEBDAC
MGSATGDVLKSVGSRLRELRRRRGMTLVGVAERIGVNESTLSRLEGGIRKPTLELLLPLAHVYALPLDELVGAPRTGDPRIHLRPVIRAGTTYVPLSRPGGVQAYKLVLPPWSGTEPQPRSHEGFSWVYVLTGRLRFVLGDRAVVLRPGEAAEFDTHVPHSMGPDDDRPAELLVLFGQQGERTHLKARTT